MKKIALVLVVLMAASSLVFAGGGQQSGGGGQQGGKARIALIIRNMNEQFLKDYADNVQKLAAEKGVELNIQDANNAPDTQLTQIQTLLNQGYKYFIILPCASELSEQMNEMIAERGGAAAYSNIPNTTKSLKVGKNFFFASSPESVAGNYIGNVIDEYFSKNPSKAPDKVLNMLLIQGQLGHPATKYRESGMLDYLKQKGYTVNYIAKDTANWTPDQAQQKMDAWIAAYAGKFNVVMAQNDGMALGAVESLIQNGYTKNDADDGTILTVPVIGVDGTQEALHSMQENKLYATVLQDSEAQSSVAFDIMYQLATTGSVLGKPAAGYKAGTPADVTDQEPANDVSVIQQCYLVPYAPITKANYTKFMK